MKVGDRICIEECWVNGTIVAIDGDNLSIDTDERVNGQSITECHKSEVTPLKIYIMRVSMRAIYEFELEATDENEAHAMLEFTDLDEDEIVDWDNFEVHSITEEK
jgi:hypothetical protein